MKLTKDQTYFADSYGIYLSALAEDLDSTQSDVYLVLPGRLYKGSSYESLQKTGITWNSEA